MRQNETPEKSHRRRPRRGRCTKLRTSSHPKRILNARRPRGPAADAGAALGRGRRRARRLHGHARMASAPGLASGPGFAPASNRGPVVDRHLCKLVVALISLVAAPGWAQPPASKADLAAEIAQLEERSMLRQ